MKNLFYKICVGADYNRSDDIDVAYPGVSLYHEGMDLVAVVSTGDDVWKLQVKQ